MELFHGQIQKVLSEGVQLCNSDNVFFRGEGIHIPLKRAIIGLPAKCHADDGPTLNAGLAALRILRNSGRPVQYIEETLYFVII